MKKQIATLFSMALALTIGAQIAFSAVIAYEGFEYTDGQEIETSALNGGTGFSGPWTGGSGTNNQWETSGTDIGYSATDTLVSSGGSAILSGSNGSGDFPIRSLSTSYDTFSSHDNWYAFTLDPAGNIADFGLRLNDSNGTQFGLEFNSFTEVEWIGQASGTATVTSLNSGSNLVIVQVEASTSVGVTNGANVWINPTSFASIGDLGTADASIGSFNNFSYDRIAVGNNFYAGQGIDEIRLATTFDDLALVPEPATYALLSGFAALGLMLLRRRLRR